jgi:hypothetical protein
MYVATFRTALHTHTHIVLKVKKIVLPRSYLIWTGAEIKKIHNYLLIFKYKQTVYLVIVVKTSDILHLLLVESLYIFLLGLANDRLGTVFLW